MTEKEENRMEKDMTAGTPGKIIFNFTMPIFIGNIFQQFYNMADTVIVGKFVGNAALAAVGACGTLVFLIIGFLQGVTAGFTVVTAQHFGAGNMKAMKKSVASGAVLTGIVTVILTLLSMISMAKVLHLMNTPSDMYGEAYGYIMVICGGIVAQALYNYLASVLRALGDSKRPLYFLVIAALLNIVLDLVFIIVFRMGAAGAAYATVIAQGISAVCCLIYIVKRFPILHLERKDFEICWDSFGRLLKLGIPMGLQFSITAIGTIIVQSAVNIYGPVHMAGFSAAGKIQNIFATVFTAFGATIATYVGQNRGAGKMDRVKQGVRYTQMMVLGWSVFVMFLMFFFGKYLTYLFVDPSEQDVVNVSVTYFRTVFWAYPFLGRIFLYRNTLQGMGYGLVPMLGGVFELVARTGIVVLIAGHTSFAGVCMADPTAWIAALIPLIPYYFHVMKKYKNKSQVQVIED